MVLSTSKEVHAIEQKKLFDIIASLEKELVVEDETNGVEVKRIEKLCVEIEYNISELEKEGENVTQEQYIQRHCEKKKQEKQLELATKLIADLRKENKRYLKEKCKVITKISKLDTTGEKIECMSNSISNMYDSISSINDIHENKFTSLQDEHDTIRLLNNQYKKQLHCKQDLYWDIAQSRLEYQKGIATILTLIQNELNNNNNNNGTSKNSSSSSKVIEQFNNVAIDIQQIAIDVENNAKVEMSILEINVAETMTDDTISSTKYTEVSEKGSLSNDCNAYLEINLVK